MRRRLLLFLAVLGAGLVSAPHAGIAGRPSPQEIASSVAGPHVPGELLVAPADGVSDIDLEQTYGSHGARRIGKISAIRVHQISVPIAAQDAVETALAHNPKVKFVEKNFVAATGSTPNDPIYPSQWHLPVISAPTGWDVSKGSANVVIAVLDSGVDTTHPDLAPKLVGGWNFLTGNSTVLDSYGHGTAVAGTAAAATGNGVGVSGVGWLNPIMPLVVSDSTGYATYARIASAMTYAADHGAKVISISIGGTTASSTMQSAVNYAWGKGLVIVASAMNANTNAPYYPAACDNVIAAAGTDQYDQKASFSNYGTWIDVAAPATYIYTTNMGGGYGAWQGTSFAAPQVAGLAALVFSANAGLSNTQVVNLIKSSADDLGAAGFDIYYGWGRINVATTLENAVAGSSTPTPTPTAPPVVSITSPTGGGTVSGLVTVQAFASSTIGVSQVALYVDNVLLGTDTTSPYAFSWDTTALTGSHTLTAVATDTAGISTNAAPVSVSVGTTATSPPPTASSTLTVSIASIVFDGKFLTISVSPSDAGAAVNQVALLVNGSVKATDTSSPWTFKFNVRSWSPGSYTIQAKAYDTAGYSALSDSKTFTK